MAIKILGKELFCGSAEGKEGIYADFWGLCWLVAVLGVKEPPAGLESGGKTGYGGGIDKAPDA